MLGIHHFWDGLMTNDSSGELNNEIISLKRIIEMMVSQTNILQAKNELIQEKLNVLKVGDAEDLLAINNVLFDILDNLVFLQLSEDVLKIEKKICPRCHRKLDEELYEKLKVDDRALITSVKKIQLVLQDKLEKYDGSKLDLLLSGTE